MKAALVPAERILNRIFLIRGHKVMLDSDLAELYGVETKILNRAVKRNMNVFLPTSRSSSPKKKRRI